MNAQKGFEKLDYLNDLKKQYLELTNFRQALTNELSGTAAEMHFGTSFKKKTQSLKT